MEASPAPPWIYVFVGAILSAVGAALFDVADGGAVLLLGIAFMWLGSVLTLAGIVGVGVQAGQQRADWKRRKTQR